jgi:sugar phosphate isomerase/epimerase
MKSLAFSTNAFKKFSLSEAVEAIAAAGYRGVELMADIPHAYPPSFDSEARVQLSKRLKQLGLAVSNINAFTLFAEGDTYHPSWIEDDERRRDFRVEHTMNCVEMAAEMQCQTVSIEPGGPMIGTSLDRKIAGERFADALERLLPSAQRHNVTLCIEPEPGLFIESAAEYMAFKNEFFKGDTTVRMNCDIGHLFCVGEEPADIIRAMSQEVAHVHLEDIGKNRVHQHLAPGKGAIDFPGVFAALREIEYRGWVTVELYPYETTAANVAREAINYLRPILDKTYS